MEKVKYLMSNNANVTKWVTMEIVIDNNFSSLRAYDKRTQNKYRRWANKELKQARREMRIAKQFNMDCVLIDELAI